MILMEEFSIEDSLFLGLKWEEWIIRDFPPLTKGKTDQLPCGTTEEWSKQAVAPDVGPIGGMALSREHAPFFRLVLNILP